MRIPFVVFAALALVSGAASASIYRWVDADGRVHYTDKPVENAEPVNIRTGQPKGAIPLDTAPAPETKLTSEQRAQKQAACDQKKKQLATYKDAAKIVETDSLGREHE